MTPSRRIWGYFYPRPHMEGDFAEIVFLPTLGISTHALTWRATVDAPHPPFKQLHFYPRPHMEGDSCSQFTMSLTLSYFYPRPHMEGDFIQTRKFFFSFNFYPRPHMEGDVLGVGDFHREA